MSSDKNKFALTPPMGWNSWDVYGASVTEEEVRGNAKYMAEYLKEVGWEYIVTDIQWYEPGAYSCEYRPFTELEMDEYSRLIPAVNRFPSAANGAGFKPLADYVHSLGLKFGIHIMRGIPRQAVHRNTRLLGTNITAREIAYTNSICRWNTDMYGVDPSKDGASIYYDSLFELYASWGVDYVKVDDSSCAEIGDIPYFAGEIELIRNAIDKCGRDIVLSLSPGPTPLEFAEHVKANANMWRMTGDYWDRWSDLFAEFERCNNWSSHVGTGHWPDADMLPVGHIGIRTDPNDLGKGRMTNFTKDEQVTMLTLWCIFRSPLMVGCELRSNDEWTLSLLTNSEVLRILKHSSNGHQVYREDNKVTWMAKDEDGSYYVALFNIGEKTDNVSVSLKDINLNGKYMIRDLWKHEYLGEVCDKVEFEVSPHGAKLVKLTELSAS